MRVILILCVLGLPGCKDFVERRRMKAEDNARVWVKNVPEYSGKFTCMNTDSDGDGYCSCTVFRIKQDPLAIECACGWGWREGCRMQKPVR